MNSILSTAHQGKFYASKSTSARLPVSLILLSSRSSPPHSKSTVDFSRSPPARANVFSLLSLFETPHISRCYFSSIFRLSVYFPPIRLLYFLLCPSMISRLNHPTLFPLISFLRPPKNRPVHLTRLFFTEHLVDVKPRGRWVHILKHGWMVAVSRIVVTQKEVNTCV